MSRNSEYSVLMSVYDREQPEFLRQSIESVLDQTVKPKDFVLVKDGPLTKELDAVVDEYMGKFPELFNIVVMEENLGLAIALNEGLKVCKCEIVARMDSDDISLKNRMELELEAMEKYNADLVGGRIDEFEGDVSNIIGSRVLPETNSEILKFAKERNPFNHPTIMFKKSKVKAAGGYVNYPYFEDYNLWATMLNEGCTGYNIQETVLFMRSGRALYGRRGGRKYAGYLLRFKWHLKKIGFLSFPQFVKSAGIHVLVSLMPNGLRRIVYQKLLRK